jgi:anti-sigma-K factor RskA
MKPCSKNRKLIAWLALGALEAREAAALHDHLARCEGCRRYWEETVNVTEGLAAAAPDSDLQASELFHRQVAEKLQATESTSVRENLAVWVRRTIRIWRVALPAIAGLVIALFALHARRHHAALSRPATPIVQVVPASASPENDLAPTIANYQMVAFRSLDRLDELLTEQGNKPLPPAPVYTISGLAD